eukprot:3217274-Amphidinium_carterae.1
MIQVLFPQRFDDFKLKSSLDNTSAQRKAAPNTLCVDFDSEIHSQYAHAPRTCEAQFVSEAVLRLSGQTLDIILRIDCYSNRGWYSLQSRTLLEGGSAASADEPAQPALQPRPAALGGWWSQVRLP